MIYKPPQVSFQKKVDSLIFFGASLKKGTKKNTVMLLFSNSLLGKKAGGVVVWWYGGGTWSGRASFIFSQPPSAVNRHPGKVFLHLFDTGEDLPSSAVNRWNDENSYKMRNLTRRVILEEKF